MRTQAFPDIYIGLFVHKALFKEDFYEQNGNVFIVNFDVVCHGNLLYVFRDDFKVVAGALIAIGAGVLFGLVWVSSAQRISACAAEIIGTGAAKAHGKGMVLLGVQVNTNGQSAIHTVDVLFP